MIPSPYRRAGLVVFIAAVLGAVLLLVVLADDANGAPTGRPPASYWTRYKAANALEARTSVLGLAVREATCRGTGAHRVIWRRRVYWKKLDCRIQHRFTATLAIVAPINAERYLLLPYG